MKKKLILPAFKLLSGSLTGKLRQRPSIRFNLKNIKRKASLFLLVQIILSIFYPIVGTLFPAKAAEILNVNPAVFNVIEIEAGATIDTPIEITDNLGIDLIKDNVELSYHWINNATFLLLPNDGIHSELLTNIAQDAISDINQKLTIKAPDKTGSFTLLIDVVNKDDGKFWKDLGYLIPYEQIFTIKDTTAPDKGTLTFTEGATTEKNLVTLNIASTDNVAVTQMKVGSLPDLSDATWETFKSTKSITLPDTLESYTYYAQFIDAENNESLAPYTSVTITRVGNGPTGSIKINNGDNEAQSTALTVDFSGITDESNIAGYKIALSEAELVNLAYQNTFPQSVTINIPDTTGTYSVFAKFIDEFGNESTSFTDDIHYTHYNIVPQITAQSNKVLFGGEMEFLVTLKNTGTDIGYNGLIEIELPKGFSYIDSIEPYPGNAAINPTYIDNNGANGTSIKYKSIADLLPNEDVTIAIKVKVGGSSEGYKIGDEVPINLKGTLYKRSDWSVGFSTENSNGVKLLPYIVSTNYSQFGPSEEILVGSVRNVDITVQNNPEVNTDTSLTDGAQVYPILMYGLENGVDYVDGTFSVENYPGNYEFSITEGMSGLKFVTVFFLDGFNTASYSNPINIYFKTEIKQYDSDGNLIPHNKPIQNNLNVTAYYEGNAFPVNLNEDFIAKYFFITKTGTTTSGKVNIGDEITYTVNTKVSKYYALSGITITDILPDGLEYVADSSSIPVFSINTDAVSGNTTGKTSIKWQIVNIDTDSNYEFTFKAKVKSDYTGVLSKLLSSDYLTNNINVEAIWKDNNSDSSGWGNDDDSNTKRTNIPEFSQTTKLESGTQWVTTQDILIGDILDVKAKVTFPLDVPTKDFHYKLYLPVGTELVGELNITKSGSFQNDPNNYTQITGGYEFNLGTVEPNSVLEINYKLNVNDDPNLKLATITRNLFRSDYTNVNGDKFTQRDEITYILIEPKIEISKNKIQGYLASGEEAVVEFRIKNTGTSTAYNLDFSDNIPLNSTLLEILVNDSKCELVADSSQLTAENCTLDPNNEFIYTYKIKPGDYLKTGDDMYSKVTVSNYQNRSETDPLTKRYFNTEKKFYWQAVEPALVTSIYKTFNNWTDTVEVGRDESFALTFFTKNVGGSPMYDANIKIDLSQVGVLVTDINNVDYKVFKNFTDITGNGSYTVNVVNGVYYFSGFNLNEYEEFKVVFTLKTQRFAQFGIEYPISIEVIGNNALGNPIRQNTSNELPTDNDNDDRSNGIIKITKLDNTNPYGYVLFKIDGQYKAFTNQDKANVEYYGVDPINSNGSKNEIIAIRFSNDGINWVTSSTLADCTPAECGDLATGATQWNSISAFPYVDLNSALTQEGKNYRYMQIADLYENIGTISNYIVVDKMPPTLGNVLITPKQNVYTNVDYTSKFDNYIHIYALDSDKDSQGNILPITDYAGIGEYQYSYDNVTFNGTWLSLNEGINTFLKTFPTVNDKEDLKIYVKVRDLAGNEMSQILTDSIIYTTEKPILSVNLNNGDTYTKVTLVNLGLNITDTTSGVNEIRLGKNETEILNSGWLPYSDSFIQYPLIDAFSTGEQKMCVQVQDSASALSNISCDTILLDTTPPTGSIKINNDQTETQGTTVILNLEALDPLLDDGNAGSGNIQMRFSQTGLTDSNDPNSGNWSNWENFNSQKSYTLDTSVGESTIYVEFKDILDNVSQIYSDKIIVNPLTGTGNILINNNDLFTNTKNVNLNLTVDMNSIGYPSTSSGQVSQYSSPVLMRFIETDPSTGSGQVVPAYPPQVTNPNQDSLGWSYWEEYSNTKQWTLSGDYSQKNVYVQYMLPNGDVTPLYHDSIIYAPYYGIKYSSVQLPALSSQQNIYTLNNIPGEALTQDTIKIKFNAKNFGSFTWPVSGDNPVVISYRWKAVSSENDPVGTATLDDYRGNAAILPKNISWNEETGELTLNVDTPTFTGKYKLIIDAIHEGVTWFSAYGNETPTYTIDIKQNPDIPAPEVLGTVTSNSDNIGGYPGCKPWGTQYTLRGTLLIADVNPWNVNYKIVEEDGTTWWIGNQGFVQYVGQEVEITIEFRPWIWGTSCYDFVVVPGTLHLVPKTWIAQYYSQNTNQIIHLYHSNEVTLEISYKNIGTGVWNRNYTFVSTANTQFEFPGNNRTTLPMRSDYVDVANGSIALFQFKIKVPATLNAGSYTVCFTPVHSPESLQYDRQSCFTIQVELTDAEKRAYRCAQPHPVYLQPDNTSQLIGNLNQNDEFVQIGTQTVNGKEWIRIYYPYNVIQGGVAISGVEGWIENSDTCFENITVVDNPIPKTELPVTNTPNGDHGIIIFDGDINVYDCPSTLCNVITHLTYGENIRVLQQTPQIDGHPGWLYIEKTDGTRGWIPKGLTTYATEPVVVDVNLKPPYRQMHICSGSTIARTGPGETYSVKKTLYGNFNTNIVLEWKDWYLIYIDGVGTTGWINSATNVCQGYFVPQPTYTGNVAGQSFYKDMVYVYPVDNAKITSPFGSRTLNGGVDYHTGVDYVPSTGQICGAPVRAAADGIVVGAVSKYTIGSISDPAYMNMANYVVIDHPNGTRTRYWHLKDVYVSVGDHVQIGQVIGTIGTTGYSSGCHLHFEFWDDKNVRSSAMNPEEVFKVALNVPVQSIIDFESSNLSNIQRFGDDRDLIKQTDCGYTYQEIKNANINDGTGMYHGLIVYNPKIGQSILVRNGIYETYLNDPINGICGILGAPTFSDGWVNGVRKVNHYTEIDAGTSPYRTTGWVQRFDNGSIYFSTKYGGYAVYGEIEKVFEGAGGTNSPFGFPIGNQYWDNTKNSYCQNFEGREPYNEICPNERRIQFIQTKLGGVQSDAYIIIIPKQSNQNHCYDVNHNSTVPLNDKLIEYTSKNRNIIAAINGDYKDDSYSPEGYNYSIQPNFTYNTNLPGPIPIPTPSTSNYLNEKSGKFKEQRTSLKINKNNNSAYFSVGGADSSYVALGGGFKVIDNYQYKFDITCYSDNKYKNQIDCKDLNYDEGSVKLNDEPVGFNDWKDYEWAQPYMPQTGFLARNGLSLVGITTDGSIVMATVPGYYFKYPGNVGTKSSGGILLSELANELIINYDVKEAFRPDGGNEASIYYKDIGVKNKTIFELKNEIPSALFLFNDQNCPYEK